MFLNEQRPEVFQREQVLGLQFVGQSLHGYPGQWVRGATSGYQCEQFEIQPEHWLHET